MKTWTCMLLIVAVLFAAPAFADPLEWTAKDTALQAAFLVVHAADMSQTLYIAKHPDRFYETNLILGKHPSTESVRLYFPVSAAVHGLVAYYLPYAVKALGGDDDTAARSRTIWQSVWIGTEAAFVSMNYKVGIKFDW